ncbi:MAG: HK97 family phage prohead protease [Treponema sp.]|nr:MAG: HK97 family phage prohead protease [Treponema sp.]
MKTQSRMNIKFDGLEIRSADGKRYISGLIPFDSMSENLGGYREVIRKGAFKKTIQESDIRGLWAHDTRYVIGRSKNSTLLLEERDDGLFVEAPLPATTWANDLSESVTRGDVPGISFGFQTIKDMWTRAGENSPAIRDLLEVKLFEVSFGVAFPAYTETEASVSQRDFFKASGADPDAIGVVLAKRETMKDYSPDESEREAITTMIRSLEGLLGGKDEGSRENRDNGEPDAQSTLRARRLALLEIETALH